MLSIGLDMDPAGARGEEREMGIVMETFLEFSQMQLWRNTFASHWEEVAELVLPTSRNTFLYGNFSWPGEKKTDRQVDATAMLALHRFAAICDSLLTPRNMYWHGLEAMNEDLRNNRQVRLWFEQVVHILFKYRYAPISNFSSQNQNAYLSLGAFGNQGMFIDQAVNPNTGQPMRALRYLNIPLGELYLRQNHQCVVDGFIRHFRLTPAQAIKQFGEEMFSEGFLEKMKKYSQTPVNFLHRVVPRTDYDPYRIDARGKAYASYYVCIEDKCLVREGGYRKFPLAASRYEQTPFDGPYGRGPIMMVLPAIKTLNAEKRTYLKQGHRAADPVLLIQDDGLMDIDLRPGAQNRGGWSADGKPLVGVLPTGQIQISEEMMGEERKLINDANLVSLFQILEETTQMTATEVIERVNEKGILLAPTIGRQQSEYLGPLIEREIDLLSDMGLLPPMPPILKAAGAEYQAVYSSPLSRAQRAQEVAGALRTLETVKEIVAITTDPSLLDPFNFDVMIPEIAQIQATPEHWLASAQEIAQKRQNRAQAQQQQQATQALPAQAAMLKAKAAVAKASGVNLPNAGNAPPPGQPTPGAPG